MHHWVPVTYESASPRAWPYEYAVAGALLYLTLEENINFILGPEVPKKKLLSFNKEKSLTDLNECCPLNVITL